MKGSKTGLPLNTSDRTKNSGQAPSHHEEQATTENGTPENDKGSGRRNSRNRKLDASEPGESKLRIRKWRVIRDTELNHSAESDRGNI